MSAAAAAVEGTASGGPVLELNDVHTYYGSIHALKGISLDVREGEIVTLLGANGAGKTTTLRSINGLNRPRQGSIRFQGRDITQVAAHDIVKRGYSASLQRAITGGWSSGGSVFGNKRESPELLPSCGVFRSFAITHRGSLKCLNRQRCSTTRTRISR